MHTAPTTRTHRPVVRKIVRAVGVVASLWLLAAPCTADDAPLEVGKSRLYIRAPQPLTLDSSSTEDCRLTYSGSIDGSSVGMTVWAYSKKRFPYTSPENLALNVEASERTNGAGPKFAFGVSQAIGGPYGEGGYGMLCTADMPDSTSKTGELFVLCGLLDQHGYYVRVSMSPALPAASRAAFLDALRAGVRAECPGQDVKWSDAEAQNRWASAVRDPQVRRQMKPPTRTAHYIVLTNTGAGARFGTLMEKHFDAVQKVFPDDVGVKLRLLPVLVFAKPDEYYAYYVAATGRTLDVAKKTVGVALLDSYATYEAMRDGPQHIRGATGQYLRNYLRLEGGGWWFRQAIEHYMYAKPSELRGATVDSVRAHSYMPFGKLIPYEGHGDREDTAPIQQAASVIAFLREGKLKPEKFMEFVRRVSALGKGDTVTFEPVVQEVYGLDLAGLETAWAAYWLPP